MLAYKPTHHPNCSAGTPYWRVWHARGQKLPLQAAAAGAKGAVSSSAQAMRRRSDVAGASMWNQPGRLASARAAYTASCTSPARFFCAGRLARRLPTLKTRIVTLAQVKFCSRWMRSWALHCISCGCEVEALH